MRFVTKLGRVSGAPEHKYISAFELNPGADWREARHGSRHVRQTLFRSAPIYVGQTKRSKGYRWFLRVQRVTTKLNSMDLAVQAADAEGREDIKALFDRLWKEESE